MYWIILLLVSFLHAAPVHNPMDPSIIQEGFFIPCDAPASFRLGYEGDFVIDGMLKQDDEGHGRVDTFQQYTNAATATLNIMDLVDLYGVFGSSRVCADWRFSMGDTITRIQYETFYHFLWAAGARAILYEWEKICLGIGGRYSYCNYKSSWLMTNAAPIAVSGTHLHFRQWQIALSLSYNIDLFTPYLGVKYSNEHLHLGDFSVPISANGTGADHFVNKTPVGILIGCSISNGRDLMLNVEGRLVDENAVTISGDLRF